MAVGLVMLVLLFIWYADAYSRHQGELTLLLADILDAVVAVVPRAARLQPVFLLCLVLQIAYQGVFVAGVGQLAKVFRSISRSGTPFAENHIKPIRRAFKLALAMFLIGTVKYGFESAMEAGVVGFWFSLDLTWVAALALVECLLSIFDYGCQLQRESDETL